MNFSQLIQQTTYPKYSPNGKMLAIVKGPNVTEKLNKFTAPDQISSIEWSPDSHMILISIGKRNTLNIRSIEDNDWLAKIEEGLSGLSYSFWLPDSQHIATVSEFNLRITIYSLTDKSVGYINNPKDMQNGHSFSPNGSYMAVLERHDQIDYVGIYHCTTLACVKHFAIETKDAIGVHWTQDGYSLLFWDKNDSSRLLVYDLEEHVKLNIDAPLSLGYRSVVPSYDGSMIAVSNFTSKVVIFNTRTWMTLGELFHDSNIREQIDAFKEINDTSPSKIFKSKYIIAELPIKFKRLPLIAEKGDKIYPQSGVSIVQWSHDSQCIATVDESIPNVVWIWDGTTFALKVVLMQLNSVKSICWNPRKNQLAISTGDLKLNVWSSDGVMICDIPYNKKEFAPSDLSWAPNGESIVVCDKVCV